MRLGVRWYTHSHHHSRSLQDGEDLYPHRLDNTIVTKRCINVMKGQGSPAALAIFQMSDTLLESVKERQLTEGYHPEVAGGNPGWQQSSARRTTSI